MRHLLINTILMNQDRANYCSIRYNGLRDVTYQSWQGNISEADLETGYHNSLNVLARTSCASVIHDCRAVAQMEAGNLNTITEQWLQQALSGGVRFVAHITSSELPVDPFCGLQNKARQLGPYEFEIFDNVDEAMIWIAYKNEYCN